MEIKKCTESFKKLENSEKCWVEYQKQHINNKLNSLLSILDKIDYNSNKSILKCLKEIKKSLVLGDSNKTWVFKQNGFWVVPKYTNKKLVWFIVNSLFDYRKHIAEVVVTDDDRSFSEYYISNVSTSEEEYALIDKINLIITPLTSKYKTLEEG